MVLSDYFLSERVEYKHVLEYVRVKQLQNVRVSPLMVLDLLCSSHHHQMNLIRIQY